jgi:two-component system sensor histidine kinase MprB
MPLRRRLGLVAASAVAIAVIIAASVCYFVVRSQLRGQVDSELRTQESLVKGRAGFTALGPTTNFYGRPSPNAGGSAPYAQVILASGEIEPNMSVGNLGLPVNATIEMIAAGSSSQTMTDVTVNGTDLRMLVFHVTAENGLGETVPVAIELARPLGPVESVLANLRLILLLVLLGGIALAAVLGRFAARRVLKPLAEVTRTAELIGETDDLTQRIAVREDDEVGHLAIRFNAMLDRLELSRAELDASVAAQRQLVADASHELRTPVTSLRTNVEVLLESEQLEPEDRRRLLADVVEQSEELTGLVGDLIEMARGDLSGGSIEDVRLDKVVEEAIARSRRNSPDVEVRAALQPMMVAGSPERLHRVINNLLDNAARHADGGVVDVVVDQEGIRVRDHGTGIDEQDLPHLFDRFYRGANSRGRQGSGLGLAIVRQVAEQHGGSATAVNAPGGGAEFTIHLPTSAADPEPPIGDDAPARVSARLF